MTPPSSVFWVLVVLAALGVVVLVVVRRWRASEPDPFPAVFLPGLIGPDEDYAGRWRSDTYPDVEMVVRPVLDSSDYTIDIYNKGKVYSRSWRVRHDSMAHRVIGWHFRRVQ